MGAVRAIVDLLLPRYCKVCGRRLDTGEEHLCVPCLLGMPRMDYDPAEISPAERLLLTERPLVRAASYMMYEKESDYRRILYHLKYYGHPSVGSWMAETAARELARKGFFDGIGLIVPVPLSKRKRRRRGYNQCTYIAQGISRVTGLEIEENAVCRSSGGVRQAGLGKYQRWGNADGIFSVACPQRLEGCHILIVDDVLTTGATLCSMISAIAQAVPDIRVSVFTLALAVQ